MNHVPVLAEEIMALFAPKVGDRLLDATVGHGGHAKAYLESTPETHVVGFDADEAALAVARENLAPFGNRARLIHSTYAGLEQAVHGGKFQHVLFDLGIGSHQIADTSRGFSFQADGPLSMLYGTGAGVPPSDMQSIAWLEKRLGHAPDVPELLTGLSEKELADVIWTYGEERLSRRIAHAIKREAHSTRSARQLADAIAAAVPRSYEHGRLHPATRTFQALRMAVNRELESLAIALPQAVAVLAPGGKLAVISFHSLEDRIVKKYFRGDTQLEILTKKPTRPSRREVQTNPRSSAAKLRVAQKT